MTMEGTPTSGSIRTAVADPSVRDSSATNACRTTAGKSFRANNASRSCGMWPYRSAIRPSEKPAISAVGFPTSSKHACAQPTSAMAAATDFGK